MSDKNTEPTAVLREALREKFPRERGQLLPALHHLQHEFGYLPDWAMETVGRHLRVPNSEVYGAATSHTELSVKKPAGHNLRVCTGLSCWLGGGADLLKKLSAELGVRPGETTEDGTTALEETACGFLCGVAPAVQWDGRWLGRATVDSVRRLVSDGEQT